MRDRRGMCVDDEMGFGDLLDMENVMCESGV